MLRILRVGGAVVAVLALLLVARFVHLSLTTDRPEHMSPYQGPLSPCPDKPNCVSSQATRESQSIDPLLVEGNPEDALARLAGAVGNMGRAKIVSSGDGYLHAEFKSALFRFVDDLEAVYDPELPGFHVRSASRVGHSDLGANRKRIEALRSLLE